MASLTFDDEARQYLVAAILRPGNAAGTAGAVGLLKRLLPNSGAPFPAPGSACGWMGASLRRRFLTTLEAAGVEYVVAMGNNAVLTRHAEPAVAPLRAVVATTQETATAYAEAAYQAGTWAVPGAPLSKPKWCGTTDECRAITRVFVITNLRQTPEWIYTHVYCARGDSENRFKELKHALAFGAPAVRASGPISCASP